MEPLFDINETCCFTGHRAIAAALQPKVSACVEETIKKLIDKGFTTFISGGAIGYDMLAASIVLRLKTKYPQIRLIMALPCKDQHVKWAPFIQQSYKHILSCADEIIYLSEKYCTGCMHLRNRFMIDNSSLCIAYMTRRTGGTAYTVKYAAEKGIEIINIAYLIT
ncbi:MAG: DUF1273 family protein [Clostridia bacterium]|nr:DUF1273 family protein [Clostridia bacterium]